MLFLDTWVKKKKKEGSALTRPAEHMGGIFFVPEHRPPESQNHNSKICTLPRLTL